MSLIELLSKKLDERRTDGSLRTLTPRPEGMIDLSSNDYLGLKAQPFSVGIEGESGAGGSRLLTGNLDEAVLAEKFLSQFHETQSALIFNSGYDANLGLLSAIAQRGTTILYDELCHASIIDGIRLGVGTAWKFKHNDLHDLTEKLSRAGDASVVVTESVFSMDGDFAPLTAIVECSKKFNAKIIVDEAHATGVFGENGEGIVQAQRLGGEIFARVHTFGKALGYHGASVVGSSLLTEYLINFARSFIYSTALTPASYREIPLAYERMSLATTERKKLRSIINAWKEIFSSGTDSPIQVINGNSAAHTKMLAERAQLAGFDIRPILSPTVPQGKERLRVCLHAFNTEEELMHLRRTLSEAM